jgi:hypothetical protein
MRRRIAVPEEALTVFGATVLSLMLEKGVRTQAQLLRLLEKEGFKASQSGFSNWLHGRHGANKDRPPAFAPALKLDERQKERLAMAYAFGQDEKQTIDELM